VKNYDLIWAREFAGLTQAAAADKIGVDRRTFSRWETGAIAMPAVKWSKLLARLEIDRKSIPPRRVYTDEGYPVGFDRSRFGAETREVRFVDRGPVPRGGFEAVAAVCVAKCKAAAANFQAECDALAEIEGKEFEDRERERHRLFWTKRYKGHHSSEHFILPELERYDEESESIAVAKRAGLQPPARYGQAGYPLGFCYSFFTGENEDYDALDETLELIEGEEFPARARERNRLLFTDLGPAFLEKEMARYDEETRRLEAEKHELADDFSDLG